ncbi:MAG: glycosyltransferase [Candidatus Methylacidiphilales bacterium]|nr:glycosyltransferase [Candidatus Methylacidiphilales bacterium]
MKKRILIMSASVGSGHMKAAEALEKAFRARPEVGEVMSDDALEYTNAVHKQFYSKLYEKLSSIAPNFLGWWYERSDEPWRADQVRLAIDLPNTLPLIKFIKDFQPDAIVCTHFMPAGVISYLIAQGKLDTHLSIVVTDYHFHAEWLCRAFHRYFVAQPEDRVHMEALGLPPERIHVTGIPVDPGFSRRMSRPAILRRFGLDGERPILLLTAGTLGLSPAQSVVRRLLEMPQDFQTVVVCGKNEALRDTIHEQVRNSGRKFLVLGYTREMRELMHVSSLLLSKPGGLTTAESLASGLPMVVLDPVGGQEERNAEMLLEKGAAIKCTEVTVLPYKVGCLLDDPARLRQMSRAALAVGKPDAAAEIARLVLEDDGLPNIITPAETRKWRLAAAREA